MRCANEFHLFTRHTHSTREENAIIFGLMIVCCARLNTRVDHRSRRKWMNKTILQIQVPYLPDDRYKPDETYMLVRNKWIFLWKPQSMIYRYTRIVLWSVWMICVCWPHIGNRDTWHISDAVSVVMQCTWECACGLTQSVWLEAKRDNLDKSMIGWQ